MMPLWGSATGSGSRARSSSDSLFCPCTRVQPGAEDPKHGVPLVMLPRAESGAPRMEGRMERMIAVMVSPDENCMMMIIPGDVIDLKERDDVEGDSKVWRGM